MHVRLMTRSLLAATTIALSTTLAVAPDSGPIGPTVTSAFSAGPESASPASTGLVFTGPASAVPAAAKPAGPSADEALSDELDQVLASSALAGSLTSVRVLDEATGAEVYSRGADQRIVPASNQKLLTSAAVLNGLGPDYRFHTVVSRTGRRAGRTVIGDLILRGSGDPTLTEARFDDLAEQVADAGITRFTGRLIADDSAFDHTPLGTDWAWDDEPYSYTAPISALTAAANNVFDTGSVAVAVSPGATAGAAGRITLTPRNTYVKVQNQTVTGSAGSASTVTVERRHGTNTVVVSGSVPSGGATATDLASVENPTLLAASVFRAALSRHHVKVTGRTVVRPAPSTATPIHDLTSMPLSELLVPFLKLSNNGHAELLVKALGHEATGQAGTWTNGLNQVRTELSGLGVSVPKVTLVDGSGLSRRDLLTTGQIANLLEHATDKPWFTTWYAALPIAGVDGPLVGGTLTNRFRGTSAANNLRAKTGTLTGVNALSGYVTDTTGRRLVFSMVSNNATSNVAAVLDQAAVKLADSGSAASVSDTTIAPKVRRALSPDGQDVECSWVRAC